MSGKSISTLTITQPEKGYRFSTDSLILSHYLLQNKFCQKILEIGSGCGVISLILAVNLQNSFISGIEIQKELYQFSIENINKNKLILNSDLKFLNQAYQDTNQNESYDLIFSNPPFFSESSGKHNRNSSSNMARHEITITLDEILMKSKKMLKRYGELVLFYPVSRLQEVFVKGKKFGFHLKQIVFIHPFINKSATHFIIHFIIGKKAAPLICKPYIVYQENGICSKWYSDMSKLIKKGCGNNKINKD